MIEIGALTDADVGRRVVWEVAPGVENPGQIAAWTESSLLLAVPATGGKFLRIVDNVDPAAVRWAEKLKQGAK